MRAYENTITENLLLSALYRPSSFWTFRFGKGHGITGNCKLSSTIKDSSSARFLKGTRCRWLCCPGIQPCFNLPAHFNQTWQTDGSLQRWLSSCVLCENWRQTPFLQQGERVLGCQVSGARDHGWQLLRCQNPGGLRSKQGSQMHVPAEILKDSKEQGLLRPEVEDRIRKDKSASNCIF